MPRKQLKYDYRVYRRSYSGGRATNKPGGSAKIPYIGMPKKKPKPGSRPVGGSLYTKGTTRKTTGGFTKSTDPPQAPYTTSYRPTVGRKSRSR